MRKGILVVVFLSGAQRLFAQNEVGPDGDKLIWVFFIFLLLIGFVLYKLLKKPSNTQKKPFVTLRNIQITLEKDRKYYPDSLKLTVKNTGNADLDIDKPMLIFSNSWLSRKFRLKGSGNKMFYPLYLEVGKTHELDVDLNKFYKHDKGLKKFPKASIKILDVKGKKLGTKSVYLKKTLLNG